MGRYFIQIEQSCRFCGHHWSALTILGNTDFYIFSRDDQALLIRSNALVQKLAKKQSRLVQAMVKQGWISALCCSSCTNFTSPFQDESESSAKIVFREFRLVDNYDSLATKQIRKLSPPLQARA